MFENSQQAFEYIQQVAPKLPLRQAEKFSQLKKVMEEVHVDHCSKHTYEAIRAACKAYDDARELQASILDDMAREQRWGNSPAKVVKATIRAMLDFEVKADKAIRLLRGPR